MYTNTITIISQNIKYNLKLNNSIQTTITLKIQPTTDYYRRNLLLALPNYQLSIKTATSKYSIALIISKLRYIYIYIYKI